MEKEHFYISGPAQTLIFSGTLGMVEKGRGYSIKKLIFVCSDQIFGSILSQQQPISTHFFLKISADVIPKRVFCVETSTKTKLRISQLDIHFKVEKKN